MGNLRPLSPGDVLEGYPADAHNAFLATYRRVFGDPAGAIGTGQSSGGPQVTVEVINKSGAGINVPFPILELTQPAFTYTDSDQAIHRGFVFHGDTPAADTDISRIAVVQGPIGDDNGGRAAVLLGPTWCQVNVTDAAHTFAKPQADDTKLVSDSASGAPIIWKESGTGTKYALILLGGGGDSETFRLIRGQSVGVQSGATISLDNVAVLSGGLDPSNGNPATTVTVANIFSQTYADNEYVDAVYSPGVSSSPAADWETLKTSTGTQSYRAIRGQTTANVTANATTFSIDNIELLADSLDPRSTPGSTSETLTIHKEDVKVALRDNDWITAIYNDTDDQWEVLLTERYRAIRGTWYSGTTTLLIDNIVVLDNGLDPRSDPTSTTEQVSVSNVPGDTYSSSDKVYADWNAKDGIWEARPKPGSSSSAPGIKIGKADSTITARSGSTAGSGTVSVWTISGTSLTDSGSNETWYNIASSAITAGNFLQAKEINGQMVIDFEDCV